MSTETASWLNTKTLIGYTSQRGNAWHYRAELQGNEPNHYAGAIPVLDVQRRLFGWLAQTAEVTAVTADGLSYTDETRQAIIRPAGAFGDNDPGAILGMFKAGYKIHQFTDWLLTNVAGILDDDELSIGSAGLLQGGAVAWVSIEVPENIVTPEGVTFRPNLLTCTSHNGTLASTYQRTVSVPVCDNTLAATLREGSDGQRVKIKHSAKSLGRVGEVRSTLGIVYGIADDFAAEVKALCETSVSDRQWAAFLDAHVPMPENLETSKRGATMATNKRDAMDTLWTSDPRVSPWHGNAYGVLQAVNTWGGHLSSVKGGDRAGRNMLNALNGKTAEADSSAMATLARVLETPLLVTAN